MLLSIILNIGWLNYKIPGFFLSHWYMFFMGVIIWWTLKSQIISFWFWLYIFLIAVTTTTSQYKVQSIAILLISIIIYLAGKKDMYNLLNIKFIQYLGKISYSLYLIHAVIGMKFINIGYRINHSQVFSIILFFGAFIVSILSAHIMYISIEKYSLKFTKTIKLKAKNI